MSEEKKTEKKTETVKKPSIKGKVILVRPSKNGSKNSVASCGILIETGMEVNDFIAKAKAKNIALVKAGTSINQERYSHLSEEQVIARLEKAVADGKIELADDHSGDAKRIRDLEKLEGKKRKKLSEPILDIDGKV